MDDVASDCGTRRAGGKSVPTNRSQASPATGTGHHGSGEPITNPKVRTALENFERVEVRRGPTLQPRKLHRRQKVPTPALRRFLRGVVEVPIIDERDAEDGNGQRVDRATSGFTRSGHT